MKIFLVNINYFHQFVGFFLYFLVANKLMVPAYNRWCHHLYLEASLSRLFNNCINLYWYLIDSSRNMKENWGRGSQINPTRKPGLLGLKVIKQCYIILHQSMLHMKTLKRTFLWKQKKYVNIALIFIYSRT